MRSLFGLLAAGIEDTVVFDPFEKLIRRTLRKLSRQRVRMVLSGNIFVIEKPIEDDEETDAALKTCWMRGWVEAVEGAVPAGQLTPDGHLPNPLYSGSRIIYRITDSGWSVIRRSHMWLLMTVMIGFLSVCAGLLGGFVVQILSSR